MATKLLEASGLSKSFGGIAAVRGMDLCLEEGESLGIIGPNGAGKTSLFNLLSGAIRPDSGRILLEGRDVTRLGPERRAELGLVRTFQAGRAFANLTVEENILVGAQRGRIASRASVAAGAAAGGAALVALELAQAFLPLGAFRREEAEQREKARELAATFGERLSPRLRDRAYSLSYANRRRVEIARALAAEPRLLLLDEPTAGMNPSETAEMLEYLQRLKERGLSMIVIEHKLPLILRLSDRVLAMDEGEKVAEGAPLDVSHNARVIEAYLGAPREVKEAGPGSPSAPAPAAPAPAAPAPAAPEGPATGEEAAPRAAAADSLDSFEGSPEGAPERRTVSGREPSSVAAPTAAAPSAELAGGARLPLLRLEELDSFYGSVQVHRGLSLEVGEGEIVCLLGGNASGKSTAMKLILGLLEPRSGDIFWKGERITRLPTPERIKLGLASVPEARRVFPDMSVEENVLMGAYLRSDKREVARTRDWVLGLFPRLAERLGQLAGTMSGGEQQMLAIARALMSRPRLVCMDEPTMGLSPLFVETVLETIRKLNREGLAVFMVEQSAHQALGIAHRGYVLQNGRLVLQGAASELMNDPRIRDAYLGGEQMSGI